MTRSFQRDGEESCVIRLCAYSADAQACVSLSFTPCRLAQSKALSSVQTRHQFLVRKKAKRALSVWEWSAITNEALRPPNSEASRQPITSPRDQLDLTTGVSPMRSSIQLKRSTMQSLKSTWSQYRGLSDAVTYPINEVGDAVVEVDSVSSPGSFRCRRRPKQRDVRPSQVASTLSSWSLRSDH